MSVRERIEENGGFWGYMYGSITSGDLKYLDEDKMVFIKPSRNLSYGEDGMYYQTGSYADGCFYFSYFEEERSWGLQKDELIAYWEGRLEQRGCVVE